MFNEFFFYIFVIILLAVCYWYYTIPTNLPPGPTGYPVIGSLLSISKSPSKTFIEFGKKYGNVFHLYMGSTLMVVLNDFDAIKEAFVKQGSTFSGRNLDTQMGGTKASQRGVITGDGEFWREHRRFVLQKLRDNGVGKLSFEPLLLNEIEFFLAELRRHSGQPYKVKQLLMRSVVNNVFILINGQRLDYDDNKLIRVVDHLDEFSKALKSVAIQNFFPWLRHIPGIETITNMERKRQLFAGILNIIRRIVEPTVSGSDKQSDDDDTYAQAYIKERKRRLELNKDENIFTDVGLYRNSQELFMAGGETSATTLHWTLVYMTFYPEIQKKVQEEIDQAIGRERQPSYTDRFATPYTEATLMELHRMVSLLPLSLAHRNIKETTVYGFNIPQSTMIIPNLYSVHHDPRLWGDPENFRPERFIGHDGKVIKPEYLIPFSIGKRQCAGEPLAAAEVYLYFVSIMQHFNVVPVHGINQSLESNSSLVSQPLCASVCMQPR